jgi:AcrR family transcriptional regulator
MSTPRDAKPLNAAAKPYHHGNLAEAILQRTAEIIDEQGIEALTLRGIARDLGMSHAAPNRHFKNKAALLAALAADAWMKARDATLSEAQQTGSDNAHVRLHAMGCGYLRWALNNRALFRAMYHPDVNRYASEELVEAIRRFSDTVREAVRQTQAEGRHPEVPLPVLTLFTNAVPSGAALLMIDPLLGKEFETQEEQEAMIEQIIDLVVPLGR